MPEIAGHATAPKPTPILSSRDRILLSAKQLFARNGYENTSTVASEVTMPLTMSSVASNDVHSCRVRGGSPRIATRNTIATKHRSGKSITSGARAHFAHRGTAGGSFGSSRAGWSAGD